MYINSFWHCFLYATRRRRRRRQMTNIAIERWTTTVIIRSSQQKFEAIGTRGGVSSIVWEWRYRIDHNNRFPRSAGSCWCVDKKKKKKTTITDRDDDVVLLSFSIDEQSKIWMTCSWMTIAVTDDSYFFLVILLDKTRFSFIGYRYLGNFMLQH
jgi:hypothetical protein